MFLMLLSLSHLPAVPASPSLWLCSLDLSFLGAARRGGVGKGEERAQPSYREDGANSCGLGQKRGSY